MHITFNINPYYVHRIGLAGIRKFNFSEQAEGRPEDFYKTYYDDSGWESIPVPGLYQPQLCMGRQLQEQSQRPKMLQKPRARKNNENKLSFYCKGLL